MKFIIALLFSVSFALTSPFVLAGGNHGGGQPQNSPPPPPPVNEIKVDVIKGKLLKVVKVKDFDISVKVVDVNDSIPDGGSHNILVKINRNDEFVQNCDVSVDVLFPDKSKKSKSLFELGHWYVAGFNMEQTGKHELSISFNKKHGQTHQLKISYP